LEFKLPLNLFGRSQARRPEEADFKIALLGVGDSTSLLQNSILSIKRSGISAQDVIVGRFQSDAGHDELAASGVTIFSRELRVSDAAQGTLR